MKGYICIHNMVNKYTPYVSWNEDVNELDILVITITNLKITNLAIYHCLLMVWTWNVEKEDLTDYKKKLKNISIILKCIAEKFLGLHIFFFTMYVQKLILMLTDNLICQYVQF